MRRPQFDLRAILIVTTALAVVFAFAAQNVGLGLFVGVLLFEILASAWAIKMRRDPVRTAIVGGDIGLAIVSAGRIAFEIVRAVSGGPAIKGAFVELILGLGSIIPVALVTGLILGMATALSVPPPRHLPAVSPADESMVQSRDRRPADLLRSRRRRVGALTRWEKALTPPRDYCINKLVQQNNVPRERSPVQIHISTADGVPIYLQIVNQVKYLVASGRLAVGDELPPIRTLAEQLIVNPNTVARAYRELEVAGIVEKRRTAGTYVSDQGSPLARRERMKILGERVDALLAEARQMGVSFEDLVELLEKRHAHIEPLVTKG